MTHLSAIHICNYELLTLALVVHMLINVFNPLGVVFDSGYSI